MRWRKGQTLLEYTVIVIIMMGVMLAMKDYVKRGIQGRWKSATDDLGDQYDPTWVNSNIDYSMQVNAISTVTVLNQTVNGQMGQWTNREDTSNTLETKSGSSQVGD